MNVWMPLKVCCYVLSCIIINQAHCFLSLFCLPSLYLCMQLPPSFLVLGQECYTNQVSTVEVLLYCWDRVGRASECNSEGVL